MSVGAVGECAGEANEGVRGQEQGLKEEIAVALLEAQGDVFDFASDAFGRPRK